MSFVPIFEQIKHRVRKFAHCELGQAAKHFNDAPPRYIWEPKTGKFSGATGSGVGARQLANRNPVFWVYCHGKDYAGAEALMLALPGVLRPILNGANFELDTEMWPNGGGGIEDCKDGTFVVVQVTIKSLPVYDVKVPTSGKFPQDVAVLNDTVAQILAVQARGSIVEEIGSELPRPRGAERPCGHSRASARAPGRMASAVRPPNTQSAAAPPQRRGSSRCLKRSRRRRRSGPRSPPSRRRGARSKSTALAGR
jgi:hypothetical protein